ncbi:hypothetical protein SDRG_07969 [Saprolegnia diclina VS20]|uniref:Uncharacterized protein n=1 Tax=Saprolegnia diclina (strain VS20) TaxID=1156394 RepID=T0Q9R6_SAPDV|nr:hypothetical protein SDRG_07969 [Saprolegnia diclina VS20]EQC34649.1 hypothetical protein SDRG_07969 [Saprolegnia diclina VS20]|eukprot:XP_008612055.1 hypothetical protein SDRG_07969 [Saprolegnia diclina VS20]
MEYDSCDSRNVSDDDEYLESDCARPYATAFVKLKSKDTFLYTLKCPRDVRPPRIHIGRKAFAWPLSKAHEKRLDALYDTDTILPASDFSIDDFDAWWATAGENVLLEGRGALGLASSVAIGVTLSHLAIDVSGNGNGLHAQKSAANAFGSVIFVLPSAHKGGRITFTQGHHTEKLDASPTVMHVAMTYLQTYISSTRLSSGRRYALVFNLVPLGDSFMPRMPPKMLEAIEGFKALAARPVQRHRRMRLSWADTHLVDVLLATGAYDVALVSFRKLPDEEDLHFCFIDDFGPHSKSDEEYVDRRHENKITSCVPHPACCIPDTVLEVLKHQGTHTFPECPRSVRYAVFIKCSPTVLVFWPTQYRAEILGIDSALLHLQRAMIAPKPYNLIGFATARDLAASVLSTFGCGTRRDYVPVSHGASLQTQQWGFTKMMGDLLLALDDVTLVQRFLRDAVGITANTPLDKVAPVVHALLHHFGWPALGDAMLGLVRRWLLTATGPLLQLLLSLAGRSARPVCAKLHQPFFGEWLKAAWSLLVVHPHLKFRCHKVYRVDVVRDLLLLDAYVLFQLPKEPANNYLGGHLPPMLLADVDDYVHGGCHVVEAIRYMYAGDSQMLLSQLPEALVLAAYTSTELGDFIDVLLAAYHEPLSRRASNTFTEALDMSPFALASFLVVLDLGGHCDVKFIASLWSRWALSDAFGPSDDYVDKGVLAVSARLQEHVTTVLLDGAPTLMPLQTAENCVRLGKAKLPTKRSLALLAMMAPKSVSAFATAWLSALPPTIEATRYLLFPIIEWMHCWRQQAHGDAVACLASVCLQRLHDARIPVRANPALVLLDIDMTREHCAQCNQVAEFLRDSTKTHVVLTATSNTVCSMLRTLVTAHKDRLEFAAEDPPCSKYLRTTLLRKVLPKSPGPRVENDDVRDDCRIAALEAMTADSARPTKRPRVA